MKIDPAVFLNSSRFDILAKYIYAKLFLKKRETNYGEEIYYEHLKVWNNCQHGDGKNGFNEYLKSFNDLLSSIKKEGFDPKKSKVNTTPDFRLLNGGHRVAACLLFDKDVHYEEGGTGQTDVDYNYFLNKRDFAKNGLHQKHCDSIALEYCKIKPNTFIATIFPSADGNLLRAEQIITEQADVFYKKTLRLFGNGPLNLMRQMYDGETWGGNPANNYVGLREKASLCFQRDEDVHVYVITVNKPEDTTSIKRRIREIFNIGNHSIHINNTWEETLKLSKCFLNSNSISYMNNAKVVDYTAFEQSCNYFSDCIKGHFLDGDDYCLSANSVFSRYGMREGKDLDYLHRGPALEGHPSIKSHNEHVKETSIKTVDDIIYNPENHFYFNGLKYATPEVIKELKENDLGLDHGLEQLSKTTSQKLKLKLNKNENISVLLLWKNDTRILKELKQIGKIQYSEKIILSERGKYNLLDQIHYWKPWWEANLIPETEKRIQNNEFMLYVFTGENLFEKVKGWKYETRNKLGIDKTCFHISDPDCYEHLGQQCNCPVSLNDYNIESIRHINMLLHKNTFEFINQRTITKLPQFDKCLKLYYNWLPKDPSNFCVDNGGVLGAYGIRDTHDLDFLCYDGNTQTNSADFGCENKNHRVEYERLGYSIKDIIDNPDNYFYHYNMKFMKLEMLKKFKSNRAYTIGEGQTGLRPKDKNDCELIDNFLKT